MKKDYIVFDNLVEIGVDGKSSPLKVQKETGSQYAQPNASGDLYQPSSLEEVKERAEKAGKRFNELFKI